MNFLKKQWKGLDQEDRDIIKMVTFILLFGGTLDFVLFKYFL